MFIAVVETEGGDDFMAEDEVIGTWGGNAAGASCSLPFVYDGEEHDGCIMEGEHAQVGKGTR